MTGKRVVLFLFGCAASKSALIKKNILVPGSMDTSTRSHELHEHTHELTYEALPRSLAYLAASQHASGVTLDNDHCCHGPCCKALSKQPPHIRLDSARRPPPRGQVLVLIERTSQSDHHNKNKVIHQQGQSCTHPPLCDCGQSHEIELGHGTVTSHQRWLNRYSGGVVILISA